MNRPVPSLRDILSPRAVAVIGASENTRKFGGRAMDFLVKHGFAGRIVPINPGAVTVFGIATYPGVGAAPGPIDVALLEGRRGQPPADVERAADVVVRASWLAAKPGACLVELDINPLLVKSRGKGAIALDACALLAADQR